MGKGKPVVFDDDNPEWTEEDFSRARPGREVLPAAVVTNLEKRRPGQRGPGKRPPKVAITFRLDPDLVERIKTSGAGYGARVNAALRMAFGRSIPKAPSRAKPGNTNIPKATRRRTG